MNILVLKNACNEAVGWLAGCGLVSTLLVSGKNYRGIEATYLFCRLRNRNPNVAVAKLNQQGG